MNSTPAPQTEGIRTINRLTDTFIRVPREADDANIDTYAFRVYCRLIRRAGSGGEGTAWESVPNMASACSMSVSKLRRSLRTLETRRMITGQPRVGSTTEYIINPVNQWAKDPEGNSGKKESSSEAAGNPTKDATPVPRTAPPRYQVPPPPVPGTAKEEPSKKNPEKRELSSKNPTAQDPTEALSLLDHALLNPDSPEARHYLTMHGHTVDNTPTWQMKTYLAKMLGNHEASHKQVQEGIPRWAQTHTLEETRTAWSEAAERYKLERAAGNAKRRLFWFVDILNGNYQPHASEVNAARSQHEERRAAQEAQSLYQATVRLPDGTTGIVASHDPVAGVLLLVGSDTAVLESQVEVVA